MSVQKLITEHLDIWTAAYKTRSSAGRGSSNKLELVGVKKLRELILELAVRGKLVPQDLGDEPASELLKRIAADKALLLSEGKLKKDRLFPEISSNEIKFMIPNGWEAIRNGKLFTLRKGKVPKNLSEINIGIPYLDIEALDRGNVSRYTDDEKSQLVTDEDLLVVCDGSRSGLVLNGMNGAVGSTLAVIETSRLIQDYVKLIFQQAYQRLNSSMKGAAIPHLDTKNLVLEVVGLPPLAEQHRIVAKVDELMAFCDQLEQAQSDNIEAHAQLVEALLATLGASTDYQDLQNNWQRIAAHFDTLFTTEHSIDELKQTILQLAVMGKLVPQNPTDEPASVLLKKIAKEKEQLIKQGKIKNHPSVEPIGDQIHLPDGWVEVVVQDFADVRLGSTPSRAESKYWGGDILWVSSGEVANCVIMDTEEKITKEGFANSSTSIIPARSLLMAIIGQGKTRGQTGLLGVEACTNQNVAAFVFNENFVVPEFVWLWAKSKYESHRGGGRGGAQPALNGKIVRSFRFPLPPFAEQHRIVTKVDELMTLCDTLKTNLQNAQTTQLALAESLVEQAVC